MPGTVERPLAGLRVLDSADEKAELCGRLLCDLGAEVIRLEPPSGALSRRLPPFAPGRATSLYFALRNAGKRGITLDFRTPTGAELLHRLLGRVDVWIETERPGALAACGLAPADVLARHPALVLTSITDFGQDGPYRDWQGTDMLGFAMGGLLHRCGRASLPPVMPPGSLAWDSTGVVAAFATAMALYRRLRSGRGQHLDVSVLESVANMSDWALPNYSVSQGFQARDGAGFYALYRCADGYVRMIVLVTRHWHALLDWMGRPDELADPKLDQFLERLVRRAEIEPVIECFFADRKKIDVAREAQQRGIPVTPLLEPGEVLENEHTRARGTFAPLEIEPGLEVTFPTGFLQIDAQRMGPRERAPQAGEHNALIYQGELGLGDAELEALRCQGVV
jgi:crotonobetainyl-CoA:carnitine CoA-transferase CaiB-like acyl-CoA transferase